MHNFKELIVWQKARNLVKNVYLLTKKFPTEEKYGLSMQIQRSCISIPSNISEGSGRNSNKDFGRFLDIAFSSAFELETQLILASDLNYISEEELNNITEKIQEVQKMIYGFNNKLKKES